MRATYALSQTQELDVPWNTVRIAGNVLLTVYYVYIKERVMFSFILLANFLDSLRWELNETISLISSIKSSPQPTHICFTHFSHNWNKQVITKTKTQVYNFC